jgi:hypothetical protein
MVINPMIMIMIIKDDITFFDRNAAFQAAESGSDPNFLKKLDRDPVP